MISMMQLENDKVTYDVIVMQAGGSQANPRATYVRLHQRIQNLLSQYAIDEIDVPQLVRGLAYNVELNINQ